MASILGGQHVQLPQTPRAMCATSVEIVDQVHQKEQQLFRQMGPDPVPKPKMLLANTLTHDRCDNMMSSTRCIGLPQPLAV